MKHLSILFLLFITTQTISSQGVEQKVSFEYWPETTQEAKPWTRWWWMGSAVNEIELRRLIKEYAERGFGGVEITPIYGVKGVEDNYIDFLTPEWMNMLRATVDAADQYIMGVDMNTGTGWPFGGPHISSELAAKKLKFYSFENFTCDSALAFIQQFDSLNEENLLALSGINESGQRVNLLQQDSSFKVLDEGKWSAYAATQLNTRQKVKRAAPGGEGLVFNHFSKDATQQYLQRFDAAFNGKNPGIRSFFNDSYELQGASSTYNLFEVFSKRKEYDLSLYLLELSGQGDEKITGRIKSDYRDVLGWMILENFTMTWRDWTNRIGAISRNQAHGSPANLIDLYSEVDIPEVETFHASHFPFLEEYLVNSGARYTESNRLFKKFASSAAHMRGRKLVSCETFTWLNEHFKTALYQCKPEIDNLFTEGVNHLFFHGSAYSPEDAAWPGWLFYASAHMEPNNPQWEDMEAMNGYIARCQSVLQLGVHTNDFLVYWSPDEYMHQPEGLEQGLSLHNSESWIQMSEIDKLYDLGYKFDFISDRIIGLSDVKEEKVYTYGKIPYKAIVLPYLKRISLTTFKKLLQMAEEGATIIFSNMPEFVSGFHNFRKQEEELASLVSSIEFVDHEGIRRASYGDGLICMGELQQVLTSVEIPRETLVDHHIKNISRRTSNGIYYFIANHDKDRVDRELSFKHGARNALFMNPMNGELTLAESSFDGSSGRVHVVLEPGASMIIFFTNKELSGIGRHPYYKEEKRVELLNPWSFKSSKGIPLILPDTTLSRPVFWTDLSGEDFQRFVGTCEYSTIFYLDTLEPASYKLSFESVEASARIFMNGMKVATLWSYPFEVDVGSYLKKGKNELRVEVSNLGANGIRYLDQQGINWKRFHDINMVDLDYEPFDAANWDLLPSGLNGSVELILLKPSSGPSQ